VNHDARVQQTAERDTGGDRRREQAGLLRRQSETALQQQRREEDQRKHHEARQHAEREQRDELRVLEQIERNDRMRGALLADQQCDRAHDHANGQGEIAGGQAAFRHCFDESLQTAEHSGNQRRAEPVDFDFAFMRTP
jgi:hypothetical protein